MKTALLLACAAVVAAQEMPIADRINGRTYPSIFQAWSPIDNLPGEDKKTSLARHDLVFHGPGFFGLRWKGTPIGLATEIVPASIQIGLQIRKDILERNPRTILIAEIRYRDAAPNYLPADHAWWKRDATGNVVKGWEEGKMLQFDVANPEFQKHVAAQARAVVQTGVVDGIMLDWWKDDADRLALIKVIRAAIGENALILVNANDRKTPQTAAYVNGFFMECYRSRTIKDWNRIAETLEWAEANLRAPRINCLETWYHNSREDLNLMRAATTLSLTLSDGYALFSDPNDLPKPDHLHNWYPFWSKSLGQTAREGCEAAGRNNPARVREWHRRL